MKIDFETPTNDGTVRFTGEINAQQWNAIMQHGFLSLFLAGTIFPGVMVLHNDTLDETPAENPSQVN